MVNEKMGEGKKQDERNLIWGGGVSILKKVGMS